MSQPTTQAFSFDKLDLSKIQQRNSISVKINGFDVSPVKIYIERFGYAPDKVSTWLLSVSHTVSSTNDGNLDAPINFAMAIIASVEYCRELQKDIPALEQAYKDCYAAKVAKYEKDQRDLDNDPEVGREKAKMLINMMKIDVDSGKRPAITTTHRASDAVVTIVPMQFRGRGYFSINGNPHPRTGSDAEDYLAQVSAKSTRYCHDVNDD